MPEYLLGDELDEGYYSGGADACEGVGGAGEEKVEEADADGVALLV